MELDFSKLDNLSLEKDKKAQHPKISATSPQEPLKAPKEYKTSNEVENPLNSPTEDTAGNNILQRKADLQRRDLVDTARIYKEYQQNIASSEQLQIDIIKGAKAGEDIYSLFLKACKAISCMTDNKVFYNELEASIKVIYGEGLQYEQPLKMELEEVQARLQGLQKALKRELEPDSQERIKRAITAHRGKINELEKIIAKSEDKKRPA